MEPDTCPACGHGRTDPVSRFCENCGAEFPTADPSTGPATGGETAGTQAGALPGGGLPPGGSAAPPVNSVPFEDRSQPFLQRLLATIGLAFSNPIRMFSGMQAGEIGAPLLYGVIIGTVTGVFAIVWNMMFGGLAMLAGDARAEEIAVGTGFYLLFILFMPLLAAIGMFISAGLFHLALLVLGDGQRGFSVTFRAVAYGNTPNLLALIPICGGFAGGIWSLILVIVGGKQGHGTDWWRAILAYFLPTILCCCLMIWLLMSLGLIGAIAD